MENTIDRRKAARSAFIRSSAFQRLIIIAVLILLYGYFYAASTSFRKYTTLVQICSNMYYTLLMAIGVTFPLITGGNDLSMGTGLICYSLIGSYLMRICGWPLWAAIVITIAMGVGMGAVNGFGVAKLDVPPFIMTLSSMMFCRGMGSILTGGFSGTWPDGADPGAGFRNVFRLIVKTETGRMPVPLGMVWMVLLVIIMTLVLNKTRVGRYTIAIGSNKEALKLSGVNVLKWHIFAYMICGFFTGLAAVTYAATFSNITPGQGAGFELNAIGSAIIGGTAMTGGSGSVFGTFLGVLLISLLQVGLPFVGLNADWQLLITGCILMGAVTIDKMRNGR
ncbi:MAG: ABC transporter permease [Clostridia bacterium]|nr:ABC transporter permease [Clostridia bacterium]